MYYFNECSYLIDELRSTIQLQNLVKHCNTLNIIIRPALFNRKRCIVLLTKKKLV